MQLLKLVAFLMFSFLSSYSFYCLFWSFPRTCPGRCDALQSWICLRGWSCSLLLMLKSEPNRLFKMSWIKSKLPVSLQSGKTELFWCKFTLIPPQGMSSNHYFYLPCGNLIMISLWKSDQFHTPRWGKNPTSLFIVWATEHFLGKFEILKALRGNMFSLIILSLLVVITNPNP